MTKRSIQCICQDRGERHRGDCPVAQAFRFRCPECRSRRTPSGVAHANHCPLKEIQP